MYIHNAIAMSITDRALGGYGLVGNRFPLLGEAASILLPYILASGTHPTPLHIHHTDLIVN